MANQTLTGATGVIRIDGKVVGGMTNINVSWSINKQNVPRGIGSIYDAEVVPTKFSGTLSASQVFIDIDEAAYANALKMNARTNEEFQNAHAFDTSIGVQLDIYKTEAALELDAVSGYPIKSERMICTIQRLFLSSADFSVSDGAFSTSNFSGVFLDPPLIRESYKGN